MSDFNETYIAFMLVAYFMFLFGMIYMVQNVEQVAQHPFMEGLVDKVHYNLRDIPRVNYSEISSDEDSQNESQEAASEASEEESDEPSFRKRRDRNPIANLLDHIN